uniref:Zinc finger PHD-type domain-containing protein n=1 Tax=Caenorhabditis japonica TaxID=281687 RepID=A0A8R1I656_CAEJA
MGMFIQIPGNLLLLSPLCSIWLRPAAILTAPRPHGTAGTVFDNHGIPPNGGAIPCYNRRLLLLCYFVINGELRQSIFSIEVVLLGQVLPWSARPIWLHAILIMLSNDGERNPGPNPTYPCTECQKNVGRNSVQCVKCINWTHLRCTRIKDLNVYIKTKQTHTCTKCDQVTNRHRHTSRKTKDQQRNEQTRTNPTTARSIHNQTCEDSDMERKWLGQKKQ